MIWAWQGAGARGGQYLAGYLIEKSLSVDNIFVFALIFGYFAVPAAYQHRVLFWGVLGALVMRAVFIAAGATLLEQFHWMIYVFGAFLVFTGVRMAHAAASTDVDPEQQPGAAAAAAPRADDRRLPRPALLRAREAGALVATPLLAVLVVVETTDIVFAVDSIPAIFAVTADPFIVFTSNVFAILGLRALYFLLAGVMDRFAYLKVGLAAVLVFVGVKMLLADVYHMPIWVSLAVIAGLIGASIGFSLKRTAEPEPAAHEPERSPEPADRLG